MDERKKVSLPFIFLPSLWFSLSLFISFFFPMFVFNFLSLFKYTYFFHIISFHLHRYNTVYLSLFYSFLYIYLHIFIYLIFFSYSTNFNFVSTSFNLCHIFKLYIFFCTDPFTTVTLNEFEQLGTLEVPPTEGIAPSPYE